MIGKATLGILEWLGLYKPIDHQYKRFELLREQCESPIEIAFWNVGYFELSELGDFANELVPEFCP